MVGINHEYFEEELHHVHAKAMLNQCVISPTLCDETGSELWKTLIISVCSLRVLCQQIVIVVSKTLMKRVQVSLICAQLCTHIL